MWMLDMKNSRKGEWHPKSSIWSNGQTSMATFILKRKTSFLQRGSSSLAWRALKNGCCAPIGLLGQTPMPTLTLGPLPNPLRCAMCCRRQLNTKPIFLLNNDPALVHHAFFKFFLRRAFLKEVSPGGKWNYHMYTRFVLMYWRTQCTLTAHE